MTDLQDPEGRFGKIVSETDRLSRNVLLFDLDNGFRAAIRPSGTEPKAKIYLEGDVELKDAADYSATRAELDGKLIALVQDFRDELLKRAGVSDGSTGVKIQGIEELPWKTDFDSFWRSRCS